jgi:8-amino-7-oxononanoate synthase
MTDRLAARLDARLHSLRAAGLIRHLHPPAGLDFSSNDYLGLARDPRVVDALAEAVRREGCGSTGSRLLRGEREAFAAVERRFAAFKGASRALYFSSGYLANLAVITTLAEKGDLILSDARNHASLIDASRLSPADRVVVPHADVNDVDRRLAAFEATRSAESQAFVVVESVFSMDGDVAPLAEYLSCCMAHDATLVVDEAHSVGLLGQRGSGCLEAMGLDPDACVSVNAAGKALGVCGAFVAGSGRVIEYLVQRARPFVFSTAAPPAVATAIDASLAIVEAEPARRERVLGLADALRRKLGVVGIDVPTEGPSAIVPVIVGENERAVRIAATLQADGCDVRAIRPPTVPEGSARLRLSVNAGLTEADLDRVVGVLARAIEATSWPAVSS